MEKPDSRGPDTVDEQGYSILGRPTSRRSTPGRSFSTRSTPGRSLSSRSTPGKSTSGKSPSGRSTPGLPSSGRSTPGRSTPDRSTTPEPPPVPPATYHWEEVRRKRSVGGYPWTHLNKPPFDEKTWVKYERDHVYEPVTPVPGADRISPPPVKQTIAKDNSSRGQFLRIPLTEELVMADDSGSEPETGQEQSGEEDDDEEDEGEDDENGEGVGKQDGRGIKAVVTDDKPSGSDESIYEGENENSSVGEPEAGNDNTRMKMFQQKVKVKADVLRAKLQGVTKRKPKKIAVVDSAGGGEPSRRKFGQFATLPKKFTFNAARVNFSTAFGNFSRGSPTTNDEETANSIVDEPKSGGESGGGRFSLPRFGFSKTSSESPRSRRSVKIGASKLSVPGFRSRTWSDASKVSKPDGPMSKLMDFGTYPRIFAKRKKANDTCKTPPPPQPLDEESTTNEGGNKSRKESFRRRFFRSRDKESTPAPTGPTLAVEEDLDEGGGASKESLAEFADSDLQEVISLRDDHGGRRSKDTKSLSEHGPGVIEEIDSDEFFLREKGLSRGDVHISNYLSSEIRDVFRSNRTRSVEVVNNHNISHRNILINNSDDRDQEDDDDVVVSGAATPVRPSRTNSLRRPARSKHTAFDTNHAAMDRFSTMPRSFGGTKPPSEDGVPEENIITSQTFEPSHDRSALPSTFRVPWRTAAAGKENAVAHMPPKPPARQRLSKFSTFDTRSMIDLSRKRSQSQSGFLPSINFSETVPKAPMRRSRTSLAGSERDIATMKDNRPAWAVVGGGVPTPPMRRSRMSLTADTDAEERSTSVAQRSANEGDEVRSMIKKSPPRPPPPSVAGYATVDKSATSSLLMPPQSPVRHRRKKSYDMMKSQEFGAFFTIPRSYRIQMQADEEPPRAKSPPLSPSRPARAYHTLGPSRPRRSRLPVREHEYGDVSDDGSATPATDSVRKNEQVKRSSSLQDDTADGQAVKTVLSSGDVIEKMKFRPLPSPPPPPRSKTRTTDHCSSGGTPAEPHGRRNTDSALVPFLDQREASATLSDHDFFADVSRALLASAAANAVRSDHGDDDVSVAVQTDPLPDGYELDDDVGSYCSSAGSDRPASRASSTGVAVDGRSASRTLSTAERPVSRTLSTAERPVSRTSATTEYLDRPTSRISTTAAVENGYAMMPAAGGVVCAQRISVNELRVNKMTVADVRSQRMTVEDVSGSSLKIAHLMAAAGLATPPQLPQSLREAVQEAECDDAASMRSSRVSSMYPEVDSDEDRTSVMAVPTPPRRRSRPVAPADGRNHRAKNNSAIDQLSAAVADPSITELSCQLFRLCHSNVCGLFTKVAQQVVPEDTEKRRDLQAALCFLSIILAGLLILGFGNEKTIHHHHWDFQFPPPNQ